MNPLTESARQEGILRVPLNAILEQHRATILERLASTSGDLAGALKSDEAVRSVASYCYEFLPWPVRMAVKKPAFVEFALAHRELILEKLAACR
ncbi:hypothetical protein H3H36_26335 [Duganella sp. FT3S]|uniref:Uncharacterized protein n=2 Tax=Rugamonas fusca TaxID=2758568 RepID=A0A7W2EMW4_9BURK|nr:hypothetical protein [Rugamonas fusca]